jgi:hypothetical protein
MPTEPTTDTDLASALARVDAGMSALEARQALRATRFHPRLVTALLAWLEVQAIVTQGLCDDAQRIFLYLAEKGRLPADAPVLHVIRTVALHVRGGHYSAEQARANSVRALLAARALTHADLLQLIRTNVARVLQYDDLRALACAPAADAEVWRAMLAMNNSTFAIGRLLSTVPKARRDRALARDIVSQETVNGSVNPEVIAELLPALEPTDAAAALAHVLRVRPFAAADLLPKLPVGTLALLGEDMLTAFLTHPHAPVRQAAIVAVGRPTSAPPEPTHGMPPAPASPRVRRTR